MINSLYVHIPFCVRKCLYCDFNSYTNIEIQDMYIDALILELGGIEQKNIKTIFVGGGTPTILNLKNQERLLKRLVEFSPEEFTLESNPGTLTPEKLNVFKEFGVNRISIGLQAWQDALLAKLGRIHQLSDFLDGYHAARKYGFNNINIDLMFGIPGQNPRDWEETLTNVIKLSPEHISSYGLIIEEGTPYYEMYNEDSPEIPDDDAEREMYHFTVNTLKDNGYMQYEISNFCKPGYECRHNLTYWRNEEYYGVGAGAHSYVNKCRYSNHREIEKYIQGVYSANKWDSITEVSRRDEISEFMFLGLRLIEGIRKKEFLNRFGLELVQVFGDEIKDLVNKGLMIDDGENLRLTKRGIDISNQVFIRFID